MTNLHKLYKWLLPLILLAFSFYFLSNMKNPKYDEKYPELLGKEVKMGNDTLVVIKKLPLGEYELSNGVRVEYKIIENRIIE